MKIIDFLGDKDSPDSNWGKKITSTCWVEMAGDNAYSQFYFKEFDGNIYGLDEDGCLEVCKVEDQDEDWHLFEEKHEPVMRYQYLVTTLDEERPFVTTDLYLDDKDIGEDLDVHRVSSFKKIEPGIECPS